MRRVLVLGGYGFFGRAAAGLLRELGVRPLLASRRPGAEVVVDVEDVASLRLALRPGDVLLDAVGPFQRRTTALVEAALERCCAVVDLADALDYVQAVQALAERAAQAGVALLPACSSVSALSAAMVRWSGIERPVRFAGFLVPAARHSAVRATAASLFASVGRPVRVLEDGRLLARDGWSRARRFAFPPPVGPRAGRLFETADAVTLPTALPGLRAVESYVDTNVVGLNALFAMAARVPALRSMVEKAQPLGVPLARVLGGRAGGVGAEVEDEDGRIVRMAVAGSERSYLAAVVPAALAVRALAEDRFEGRGVIPPHLQVDDGELRALLARLGMAPVLLR
ncbi:MAG TPA: hypothetical protein VFX98_15665 [Longimicrobiaceae bacterium]|nr:hypothetical protein [Longimicrobiaceae bacterium]